MDWLQILLSLYFALVGAYLSIVLTRILKQNGRDIRELIEKMSQQHQDMVELLKRGFSDLSSDVREIKETAKK